MTTSPHTSLYIDGRTVETSGSFDIVNPLTRKIVGTCSSASIEDCKSAVDAAERAFPAWEKTPLAKKREILLKTAELIESEAYGKRFVEAQSRETAGALGWIKIGIAGAASYFRTAAGMASELQGQV